MEKGAIGHWPTINTPMLKSIPYILRGGAIPHWPTARTSMLKSVPFLEMEREPSHTLGAIVTPEV